MKFYELYVFLLLGNIQLTFVIFLYIYLALIKLFSFSKKIKRNTFTIRNGKLKIFMALLVSTIVNFPNYIFTREISMIGYLKIRNSTNHVIDLMPLYRVDSSLDKNQIYDELLFVLTVLKGFMMIVILIVINMTVLIKLKLYLRKKILNAKNRSK